MPRRLLLLTFVVMTINAYCQPDVPVDPLTGQPQISIPIWTLRSGSITAPLSLAYQAGVKVGSTEGDAGMGWSLVAGGSIERQVHGLPDDFDKSTNPRKGWLTSSNQALLKTFSPSQSVGCADWTAFNAINSNGSDTEPDVFYVHAPGLTGKFVFDNDDNVRFMPWQDLNVVKIIGTNGRITKFTITNNQGVVYVFELGAETTITGTTAPTTNNFNNEYLNATSLGDYFYSNWQLTSISGSGGESISFSYSSPVTLNDYNGKKKVNAALNNVETLYATSIKIKQPLLEQISAGTMSISLSWNKYNTPTPADRNKID